MENSTCEELGLKIKMTVTENEECNVEDGNSRNIKM
jgi:hypothetical protein